MKQFNLIHDFRVRCPVCGSNSCMFNYVFYFETSAANIAVAVDRYRFGQMIDNACMVSGGIVQKNDNLPQFFVEAIEMKGWAAFCEDEEELTNTHLSAPLNVSEFNEALQFAKDRNVSDMQLVDALLHLVTCARKQNARLFAKDECTHEF